MATVGNLFVNVRGRTGGFVRDIKKANKKVTKDFYLNEAMALQRLREAREKVGRHNEASPERFQKAMGGLRTAEARYEIAQNRPGRLQTRKGLMGRKARAEAIAREAKSVIPLLLGVPAVALAFAVRNSVKAMSDVKNFAVTGPSGGEFITAKVGKQLEDLAFAQRPDVSRVMAETAKIEQKNARVWREAGLQFQIVMNAIMEKLFGESLDVMGPKIRGDEGFVAGQDTLAAGIRARDAANARRSQQEAKEWMSEAFWMFD